MSEELLGVVVCHGSLAGALVQAAEQISGIPGALVPVSNTGCDRDTLEERVLAALGGRPAVVFVDAANRIADVGDEPASAPDLTALVDGRAS